MPLGPVSSTGRAMMESLQQAMAKGMPVDQAVQYVKGMATQGVAPMADLYAMLNQLQRLQTPTAPPPQGGTVKDQINAAVMQRDFQDRVRREQQARLHRGLPSMAAERAVQDPMAQGLGSVPAPVMDNAQFAGGGIVAFDDGGFIATPKPVNPNNPKNDPLYPEETMRQIRQQAGLFDMSDLNEAEKFRIFGVPSDNSIAPATDKELFYDAISRVAKDPAAIGAGLGAIVGGPVGMPIGGYLGRTIGKVVGKAGGGVIKMAAGSPGTVDYTNLQGLLSNLQSEYGGDEADYLTRQAEASQAAYERMGLGAAAKAREADIAQQEAEARDYTGRAEQGNLAQYFFDMAANASKPGARFLSAAAQAAPGYGQRKSAIDEKTRLLGRAAKEGRLKLMEAEELRKAGYIDEAKKRHAEGVKHMIEVGSAISKERGEMERARISAKAQKETAEIYRRRDPTQKRIDELNEIIATKPRYSEEYKDAVARLNELDKTRIAAQAKLTGQQRSALAAVHKADLQGINKRLESLGLTDTERANLESQKAKIIEDAEAAGINRADLESKDRGPSLGVVDMSPFNQFSLTPQRGNLINPINQQSAVPTRSSNPYANLSNEELMKKLQGQ